MILDIILIVLFVAILVLLVLMRKQLASIDKSQMAQDALNSLHQTVSESEREIKDEIRSNRQTIENTLANQHQSTGETLLGAVGKLGEGQSRELKNATDAINNLTQTNENSIKDVRDTVDKSLGAMQVSNENKLDEMRQTVDQKLQSTLEKRLGESFNIVSDRLEEVQRGLGEMRNLATGVGDLQRVLTNVRARGAWGEVQLGALLDDILTVEQYGTNVQIRDDSREVVEYAVRLPGRDDDPESYVLLPIDSKFPMADYERLVDATDVDTEKKAIQSLIRVVETEASKIQEKYIVPPRTTEFAIMFLPTEGLYAEVLRSPGLSAKLLQRYQIIVAGPTTLAAILTSLRVGFRTLAIQKRSSEVWDVLRAVKTEFGKFGNAMATLKNQVNRVSKAIDDVGVRRRAMDRKLRKLEELPPERTDKALGISDDMSST